MNDFQEARGTVTSTPGWSSAFAHVLDFTDVTSLELSHADVRTLSSATPVFDIDAPQILVARAGSVQFGLARMFQTYADGRRKVYVVDSFDAARALVAKRI